MGTFTHPVTLISVPGEESETVEALVDTGATFSAFPRAVLQRLGVKPYRTLRLRLADGREEDWEMGQVQAELDGTRNPILCLFGAAEAPPLLGAHALEAFLLTADPVERRLVPKAAYLLGAEAGPELGDGWTLGRCGWAAAVTREQGWAAG